MSIQLLEKGGDVNTQRPAFRQAVDPIGLTCLPAVLSERVLEACAVPMIIFESRASGCLVRYVNPAFVSRTGYSTAAIAGMGWDGLHVDAGRERGFERLCAAIREQRELEVPLRIHRKGGATFSATLCVSPVGNRGAGTPGYAVGALRECAADAEYVSRLEREARYDPLTGLANRRLLAERSARAITQALRADQLFGVAVIDLDDFKLINDTLGHAAGDEVICTVGSRLAHDLRAGDFVARVGGDEFVLLLQEPSDGLVLASIVERVKRCIEQPIHLHGQSFIIGCSIGLAVFPMDGEDLETLLRHADRAMYRQKAGGRSRKTPDRSVPLPQASLASSL